MLPPSSDATIVLDISFLASTDPVVLDEARFNLVNHLGLKNSMLYAILDTGSDKFCGLRYQT
jgi:uncharacterized Fe-S center protein